MNLRHLVVLCVLPLAGASHASAFFRVLLVGDSIGTGYGVEDRESFARLLADGLREKHSSLRLVNLSQNGLTTAAAQAQIDRLLQFAGKPEIFILEVGGNDFLTEVNPDRVKERVLGILKSVQSKYPQVRLVVVGVGYPANENSPYRAAAESIGATCVDGFAWENRELEGALQKDKIHPSPMGHKEIAEAVLAQLR